MKDIFTDLYKKVIGFFKQEETNENSTKEVACNRLKLVLMQDRTNLNPQLLERMRGELIDLLSKYVEMDKEALELNFEQEGDQMALMLSIPVIKAKDEAEIEALLAKEAEAKAEAAAAAEIEAKADSETEAEIEADAEAADQDAVARAEGMDECEVDIDCDECDCETCDEEDCQCRDCEKETCDGCEIYEDDAEEEAELAKEPFEEVTTNDNSCEACIDDEECSCIEDGTIKETKPKNKRG